MNYYSHYERRRHAQRLDRQNKSVADIVAFMRDGATLHLRHSPTGNVWWLSSGRGFVIHPRHNRIPDEIARLVIINPLVAPADDALFPGASPQTYRHRFHRIAAADNGNG